jgi:hypothetical protein
MKTENVIFRDSQRIAQSETMFQDGKQPLQNIVEAFAELGIGAIQDFNELARLMNVNPSAREFSKLLDNFIQQKIGSQLNEADIPSFGMFKMRKKAAVAMIETPDVSQFVEVYSENFQAASYAMELADLVKGKIVLSKAKHSALVERHTVSAKTAEEKTILAKLHGIVETLKELHTAGALADRNIQQLKQIRMLANTKDLQIDPAYFSEIKSRINQN